MNPFIAIGCAFFYLVSSLGITVSAHYCHGKLDAVKIYSIGEESCCAKIHENPCVAREQLAGTQCCEDQEYFIQFDQEHIPSYSSNMNFEAASDILCCLQDSETTEVKFTNFLFTGKDPPRFNTSRRICFSSLTFYS